MPSRDAPDAPTATSLPGASASQRQGLPERTSAPPGRVSPCSDLLLPRLRESPSVSPKGEPGGRVSPLPTPAGNAPPTPRPLRPRRLAASSLLSPYLFSLPGQFPLGVSEPTPQKRKRGEPTAHMHTRTCRRPSCAHAETRTQAPAGAHTHTHDDLKVEAALCPWTSPPTCSGHRRCWELSSQTALRTPPRTPHPAFGD